MERNTVFIYWKTQHSKDVRSLQLIYTFQATIIKIPARFSYTDSIILKCIGMYKGTKIPNTIWKRLNLEIG